MTLPAKKKKGACMGSRIPLSKLMCRAACAEHALIEALARKDGSRTSTLLCRVHSRWRWGGLGGVPHL